jgi:hypothetical protein
MHTSTAWRRIIRWLLKKCALWLIAPFMTAIQRVLSP